MRTKIITLIMAACCLAAVSSCSNAEIEEKGKADASGLIELSVKGVLGEYKAEETKSSLVNNIRVGWEKDAEKKDTVLVFHKEGQKYLGYLVATVQNGDDRTATLSGTIAAPEGDNKTLVFVHGTGLRTKDFTAGATTESVPLDLSAQGEKTPFLVFGTAPYVAETVSNVIVDFSFATSVVSAYAAGLPASTAVTKATLSGINTKCVLDVSTLAVSGDVPGTITKGADIGSTNAEGQVLFEIAVPVSEAAASGRSVEFTIDSEPYTTAFSGEAIEAGKAYSAMSENHPVEVVVLGKTSTTIFQDAAETLTATVYPSNSTNKAVTWTSSNDAVATVDQTGKVTGQGLGTATITATSQDDPSFKATCTVTVDNHEYVVIGGLKWAKMNIGANNPSDYGWYFSWGNTEGYVHNGTNWVKASDNTKLGTDGSFSSANYNNTPGHSLSGDISPASVNDAARINWGGDWRMPTKENFVDLAANGVWIWTSDYNSTGKSGYIVYVAKDNADKGKAKMNEIWKQWNSSTKSYDSGSAITEGTYSESIDDHIFFPAAGGGLNTSLTSAGSYGVYWSSTWGSSDLAYYLNFYSSNVNPQDYYYRYYGVPVRPVSDL